MRMRQASCGKKRPQSHRATGKAKTRSIGALRAARDLSHTAVHLGSQGLYFFLAVFAADNEGLPVYLDFAPAFHRLPSIVPGIL